MANNNKHTGPNVPALRFPEFSGEWETKTMLEIAPLQRGFDLPKGNIRPGDIPVVYSNGIMSTHNQSKCIGPGVITGRSGTIGSFTFIPNGPYWPHNTALWVTNFCGNVPLFIYHLYSHIGIVRFASGSGVPTLNRNDVHKHITSIPSNLREQNKIASFLSLLDDRIETQSKIIEEQETLLKSLADRMFSENQYSCGLSELVDIVKGKQVNADTLSEEGDYYVMNGGVAPSGYYSEYNVPAGSISISEGGNSCGYVQFNEKPFWSGGHCYSLRAKSDIVDYKYLYYFLKAKQSDVMALRIGSGLPNIQKKDIEKFTVSFPSMVQQLRYVKVLDAVSEQLDAEKSILVLYHKQKEHLLSEMFI